MGNRSRWLQHVSRDIEYRIGKIVTSSSVYETEAWGNEKQETFLNQCVIVETQLDPEQVMDGIIKIENTNGRNRTEKWGPRTIDIDILFYNDIYFKSEKLQIPHVQMEKRRFTLQPLGEIAGDFIHEKFKIPVSELLEKCEDNLKVWKFIEDLPYNLITIEGNIGAGKTSLAERLSKDYNGRLVLEQFANNPFLPSFYENPQRFGFPLELFFMAERFQQMKDTTGVKDIFYKRTVCDYLFVKSLLFAKVNLTEEEFKLYQRLFSIIQPNLPEPEILIYLHNPVDKLLDNISKRGRDYEKNISADYLKQIEDTYFEYFRSPLNYPVIILNAQNLDFVNSQSDYQKIISLLNKPYTKGVHKIEL